jgi:rubrerythrin
MDSLVNIETGEIDWVAIKKMYKDATLETSTKKFNCKKCNTFFYSKNYDGEFPLCIKHRNNTFK